MAVRASGPSRFADSPPSGLSTVLNLTTSSFLGVRVAAPTCSWLVCLAARNDFRREGCLGDRNLVQQQASESGATRSGAGVLASRTNHPPWFVTFCKAILLVGGVPEAWERLGARRWLVE